MTHAEMGSTALWLMLLLGAYHGINPGMGWLFAVALGMQEQKGKCRRQSARPDRARPRVGHRRRGAGGGVSRHGAAAEAIRYLVAALLVGLGIYSWCGIITRAGSACRLAFGT